MRAWKVIEKSGQKTWEKEKKNEVRNKSGKRRGHEAEEPAGRRRFPRPHSTFPANYARFVYLINEASKSFSRRIKKPLFTYRFTHSPIHQLTCPTRSSQPFIHPISFIYPQAQLHAHLPCSSHINLHTFILTIPLEEPHARTHTLIHPSL